MTTPTRSNPMSGGTEIKSLEQRIASIEKRNAARDEYIEWVNGDDGPLEGTMARAKWAAIKARHGLSPTPGAETVPPPAGKERWFMNDKGFVREYPSGRWWYENGTAAQSTTIATMAQCIADGDTELDGPPPHGKPLAAQGKGMPPDRSIEDRATAAWSTPEYRHLTGPAAMAKFAQTETARLRQQLSDVTGEREAYRATVTKLEERIATLYSQIEELKACVRRWVLAATNHYPLGWAMDPSNPELTIANVVEGAKSGLPLVVMKRPRPAPQRRMTGTRGKGGGR